MKVKESSFFPRHESTGLQNYVGTTQEEAAVAGFPLWQTCSKLLFSPPTLVYCVKDWTVFTLPVLLAVARGALSGQYCSQYYIVVLSRQYCNSIILYCIYLDQRRSGRKHLSSSLYQWQCGQLSIGQAVSFCCMLEHEKTQASFCMRKVTICI